MNVKLLTKIQKHILAEPRRLDMDVVLIKGLDPASWRDVPPCGTVGCIGGWAYILSRKRPQLKQYGIDHLVLGRHELKITAIEADRLFDTVYDDSILNAWPKKYIEAYLKAKSPAGRARAAVRRIDHFIATKGAE
jgi:hypothetical protein